MPQITRVYKTTKDGGRLTLEEECLKSGTLPSIAYGFKRCSLKHKIGPQEKFCNNYPPCRKVWNSGKKVVKFIGYDAGEHYRSDKVLLRDLADPKYSKWYPLMEWGWDRKACVRAIEAAGLPQPGKSSCFFCPSMRAEEIIDLRERYPDLFRRALALEDINPNPIGGELTDFFQTVERKNWLDFDGVTFSEEDSVLTLSTCCRKYDKTNSGNQRLVVLAKLLPEGATEQAFTVKLVKKPEMP